MLIIFFTGWLQGKLLEFGDKDEDYSTGELGFVNTKSGLARALPHAMALAGCERELWLVGSASTPSRKLSPSSPLFPCCL